ncbi:chloramphenicol-sensitive protein RarD [Cribrihabitans marinus]|uniref:Chloramphenicol-sensitive protein RarD n=1 Tax=Cribrihabitans marinus TaxID=1227549 RepID=A0A1H6XXQ5_9RHOB|nr:EamA family transporter RarD [Cribrihabitans marinus]GGH27565.1 permease [Cribrihabitans marinus]SEJ29365.1 chloramphenicol-sensitive protein RarD [Cribrihabitans marinus]
MTRPAAPSDVIDPPLGLAYAVGAYVLWGFLPFYMKAVAHVPPVEVVAHRVVWSVPLAGALLVILGRTADLRAALSSPRTLAMGCLTAGLVSINWAIYVLAIANDRALDAALGYYINPLFSVFLASVLLRERLSRSQMTAVALAALAVLVLVVEAGRLPWPALGLTFSWGFYAFFKKSLPVGPNQGFLMEVLILMPAALGYLLWLQVQGLGHFGATATDTWLLLAAGLVTAVPLILYANGAKLIRLSTIGILQFIAPTMIFLVAVLAFGEQMDRGRMIAFPMIWAALVIYTAPMLPAMRRRP